MPTALARTKQANELALLRRMIADAERLRLRFSGDANADAIAQGAVCAAAILAAEHSNVVQRALRLVGYLDDWENISLDEASVLSTEYSVPGTASSYHLFEPFLHKFAATSRRRHGVFFTPQPVADYIVAEIGRLLSECCEMPEGIAAEEITLIDPACGTGVFLLAAIDRIHQSLKNRHPKDMACRWNDFVPRLLPRLIGVEILPAAALLARLNIALKLIQLGYEPDDSSEIRIIAGDALTTVTQSKIQNPKSKNVPVLFGNPPFSSLSTNSGDWITRLVRGDVEVRGYIRANGQQLGERKTWLHDDYVKFIRLAQWHVEEAGCGIVGFVTNHGYLDNATFRLMRQELLRVFSRVHIVDLHGNRKKHEVAPDGNRDENVFGLDQGVAIGLFGRPPIPLPLGEGGRRPGEGCGPLARSASEGFPPSRVEHAELWGTRDAKLRALDAAAPSLALRASVVTPNEPDWRFIPSVAASRQHPEYATAWSLADAMPINATAPVTARDHFVVAFTRDELEARIEAFRDLSIPNEEIRDRFFSRTRSTRYQTGDTRGWKLAEARRIVAADAHWRRHIVRCLYRPFDWRYVFWHPAMIDWPRTEVTRHLLAGPNSEFRIQNSERKTTNENNSEFCILNSALCLLARRQQLPTQPCTFFWIADCLPLDGVIRSDNRGSESLFPLYLLGEEPGAPPQANFAPAFVESIASATQLAWLPLGRGDLARTFGPEDLLAYIYALFHAPSYRERYADALRSDFPRVLGPRTRKVFERLSQLGSELIEFHLPRGTETLNSALRTLYLPASIAQFRAGGYVALKKWLQPRHRSADDPQYARIAAAVERTLEIMRAIDGVIG